MHSIFRLSLALTAAFAITTATLNAQTAQSSSVTVTGQPVASPTPYDYHKEKAKHIMPEVSGTQITVTKKATVIKLDQQPQIENNNLQEEFTKAPGFLVTEQHTPGQFNFSYRGLGNPQESEFVSVMQDGLPLEGDWIGFPTLYYLPLPQSISEIQFIRGGGSLLYGPEPAPVVNFVTKHPTPDTPWNFYTEELGGPYGFFSTYNAVQEAQGPLEFRMDAGYVHSDGQRDNSQYDLWQANGYFGYRPDENQLYAVDVHASRFDGGDPGRLPNTELFNQDQNQTLTPYNEDWVDRYTVELRTEQKFGDDWLFIGKAWYTHEQIDSRAAANLSGNVTTGNDPTSTVFGYEEFNNGGVDLRVRKNWGDDTMFHGSTLTFGGVVYHGDAPFQRYTLQDSTIHTSNGNTSPNFGPNFLYAPRGSTGDTILNGVDVGPTLDQSRNSDYQSIFGEDLIRLGQFHMVLSFRLDHENVEVDSSAAPWLSPPLPKATGLSDISADHWVPLWGFGMGNDFGNHNETYFSASSGWRPTRYFDLAGTSRTIALGSQPSDPFHSLDFELGVHGTPIKGFWYDVGAFWMVFENRTESLNVDANGNPSNTDFVIENTGTTRNRGLEGELSYDFLSLFQDAPVAAPPPTDGKDAKDMGKQTQVPGAPLEAYHPFQLIAFTNLQLLDAVYTESNLHETTPTSPTLVGNPPAFAPDVLWKWGVSFRKEKRFDITLTGVYVSSQFWQDSNQPSFFPAPNQNVIAIPAKIPSYFVMDLSGYYYITKNVRFIAGVSNLNDRKYYDRVFSNGLEPAPSISGYAGLSVEW